MLNISTIGNFGNELYLGLGNINAKAAIRVINEHKDQDRRDQGPHQRQPERGGRTTLDVLTRARSAADETGLPIMMHWTNEPQLLALLKRGDILTHPFNIPTPNQSQPVWRRSPARCCRRFWSSRTAASGRRARR